MEVVDRYKQKVVFKGDDGDEFIVEYDNRGEPYRDGAVFRLYDESYSDERSVFLEESELRELKKVIDKLV